ncbi:hypothetical protein LXT21_09815 [Myxococcus sp. K38C18041901]|uniref:hypothetical protein n=1 Tax=Myxococcus guangdongensis TaxID=2906760 RepID=UPI0020A81D77|nr:hypothetical protein [Myxococcus guangdongensis]MCP3059067.1 hypothetical protein [Myxococcus guangdongensis]
MLKKLSVTASGFREFEFEGEHGCASGLDQRTSALSVPVDVQSSIVAVGASPK